MAKVIMFPQKKKLPKGVEERLREIAKEYVNVLYSVAVLMDLEQDKPAPEEVMEMVGMAFADGICEAIDEMDEL